MGLLSYHSALRPPLAGLAWRARFEGDGSCAFVYDLVRHAALPAEYAGCDVLYTEMAWERGYPVFLERADAAQSTFAEYQAAIGAVIEATTLPVFLITGKAALRRLPAPASRQAMTINGGDCLLAVYHTTYPCAHQTNLQLLEWLASRYQCVGDFCCGYGNTGRVFQQQQGKRWVMSDLNGACIDYIARHAHEWGRR